MTTDPVHDAGSHFEKMAQENEAFALAEKRVGDEIVELFTKTVRKVNYKQLATPFVSYSASGGMYVRYMPLSEAVVDTSSIGKSQDALMAVMAGSDCPLVAKWREAMAEDYKKHHAADIAQVEVGV